MKTFEEVLNEMDDWEKECLMTTSEFIDYMESGFFKPYDGVGDIHDGNNFITNGFEVSIFTFIEDKVKSMGIEDFIEKYPYVAWYSKWEFDLENGDTIECEVTDIEMPNTNDVLDKIRAEIKKMDFDFGDFYDHTDTIIEMVLEVIDKYRAESENKE